MAPGVRYSAMTDGGVPGPADKVVTAKPHRSESPGDAYSVWQLRVRPGRNKIYIAEANSQPKGGQVWEPARSRPFRVRVIKR